MMKIRKLKNVDAPLMLEWMHDDEVVHYLRKDFAGKTLEDCCSFINEAQDESENIHLAIVDDNDRYIGTVSLKHIHNNTAEFGIALRACAIGNMYSYFGMNLILEYGFQTRGVNTVYWCVDPENQRAIRFYEKYGYHRCDAVEQASGYTDDERQRYIWYQVKRKTKSDEETI